MYPQSSHVDTPHAGAFGKPGRAALWTWCVALSALLFSSFAAAQSPDPSQLGFWLGEARDGSPVIRLHYFHSPTCEHCKKANPVIAEMESRLPWLQVERHSVLNNQAVGRFMYELTRTLGNPSLSTPTFVFCGNVEIGFGATGAELERKLTQCHQARVSGIPFEIPNLTLTGEPDRGRSDLWLLIPLALALGGAGLFAFAQVKTKRAAAAKASAQAARAAKRLEKKAAARERRRK